MSFDISARSLKDPIEARGDRFGGEVAFDLGASEGRFPLDVVFCIDNSGSMSGNDIATAREGLAKATQELGPDDQFGVVAFNSSTDDVVTNACGANASQHTARIRNISAGGSTDIMKGLKRSKRQLQSVPSRESIQWIILITDGGASISERTLERDYAGSGISVHTAGIGNYKRRVVKTVAERTQGEWEDVGDAAGLQEFFGRKVNEARGVVALNPELELRPASLTEINDVHYTLGTQQSTVDPEWRGDTCIVDLSDLNVDKVPKVALDLAVDGGAGDDVRLLEAELRTDHRTVSDELLVEIAPPFIAKEESEGDGTNDMADLAISEIMEAAQEDGPGAAERKIEKWEDDVDEEVIGKAEDVIDGLRSSTDGKGAQEETSRFLATWDEDD